MHYIGGRKNNTTLTMFNELNWILFFIEAYISKCSIALKRIDTLATRGFFLACVGELRFVGRRPKTRVAKPREKPLAQSVLIYRARGP